MANTSGPLVVLSLSSVSLNNLLTLLKHRQEIVKFSPNCNMKLPNNRLPEILELKLYFTFCLYLKQNNPSQKSTEGGGGKV